MLRLKYKEQQIEEYGHGDIDPVTVKKKMSAHERLAEEMKQSKIECEALPLGSHPIEGQRVLQPDLLPVT